MFHLFKKKSKTPTSQTSQTKNDLLTFSQSLHPQIPSDETKATQTFQFQTTNASPKDLKNQRLSRYLLSDSFSSSGSSFDNDDIESQSGANYDEFYLKFAEKKETDLRMANTDRGTYYKREHILDKEEQESINKQSGSDKVSYPDVYIYNMCNTNQPKAEDKKADLRSSRRSFSNIEEVESLKISFKKSRKFSPQQLADLANRISNSSTDIKMISLEFKNCPDLSNHDLSSLGASLGVGKKSMEYLSLVFVKCERISEQGILSLINGLFSDLSMIKGLRLRLRGCKEITDLTAHSLIARLCVELSNLDDLIVDFDACGGVTQTGIKNLSQQISAKDCIVQLSHCGITFYKWWWAPDNGDQEAEAYIRRRLAKSGNRGVMFKFGKINCSVNRIISSNFEDNALPIWSAEIENTLTKEKQSSRKTNGKDLRKMKKASGIAEFNQTPILA